MTNFSNVTRVRTVLIRYDFVCIHNGNPFKTIIKVWTLIRMHFCPIQNKSKKNFESFNKFQAQNKTETKSKSKTNE